MLFLSNFLVGLSCTLFLFVLSIIVVLSFKAIYLTAKEFTEKRPKSITQEEKPKKKRVRKPKSDSAVIHSVEIDPTKVDKIYVKKSS